MKKIMVHLHLYYEEQFDMFAERLNQALSEQNYDLFITISNCNDEIKQKFLSFKPDAVFIVVKNIGADIYPFITVLNFVNLEDYDYIIKLHTKKFYRKKLGITWLRSRKDDIKYIMNTYMNRRFTSFLTRKNIEKIISKFEKNPKLGMVADHRIISINHKIHRDKNITDETKKLLKSQDLPCKSVSYPSGTMFIARASLFNLVKRMNLNESYFYEYKTTQTNFPYVMEQYIGNCANANGFKLKDVYSAKLINYAQYFYLKFSRFFFRIEEGVIKILKIPVFRLRMH